jgi:hypothetical protein
MTDPYYNSVRDYTGKLDVVTHFTLAPKGSPTWALDAEKLWNAVEARETGKKWQVAFEWEVALPNELKPAERESIAREFSQWLVDEYGVPVTTGIHEGGTRGNGKNDHMHVMMGTRPLDENGWAKRKLRDFNSRPGKENPEVTHVRKQIAEFINDALEDAGSDERVDYRSFKERGITQEPTKHLGPAGSARERIEGSDRGDINREIIEERLRWQIGQAEPEISPEVERMLSQRWDDWQPLQRGVEMIEATGAPALAHGTPADTSEEHVGWRRFVDRVRAFQAKAVELWNDETSGAPEADRGFAARLFDTGRKLAGGWRHHNNQELIEGLDDAAALESALEAGRAGAKPPDDGQLPETFTDRVRKGAAALWHNERGCVPDDDFDRAAEQWHQAAPHDEGPPAPGAPEPHHLEPEGPDIE